MTNENKMFITATEMAEMLGISKGHAYKLIRELNSYLADLDKQAEDMFLRLVKQMAEREGVTEQLKADNQMERVVRMNNIRSRATEVVNTDIIYN